MAIFDFHATLARATVAVAPAPVLTGLLLEVGAGEASVFPAVPFNCTIYPSDQFPTLANAEVVRVTNIAGDSLTITRAQEGTTAKNVAVGYLISNSITVKVLTDIEAAVNAIVEGVVNDGNYGAITVSGGGLAWAVNPTTINRSMLIRPLAAQSALAYGANVVVDFNGDEYKVLTLSGDVSFTSSNRGQAKSITVKIIGDGSLRTLSFPAGWVWLGDGEPASLASGKVGVLSITSFGNDEVDVIAVYSVQNP